MKKLKNGEKKESKDFRMKKLLLKKMPRGDKLPMEGHDAHGGAKHFGR